MAKKKKVEFPKVISVVEETKRMKKELMIDRGGRYFFRRLYRNVGGDGCSSFTVDAIDSLWTVYTKDAACKRGDYAEEIDVLISGPGRSTEAMRVAQAALKAHYVAGLRTVRAVYRGPSFLFY